MTMDPLSDVFRSVRLCGALFFLWDISVADAESVPNGKKFAPILLPGAQQIISYHLVVDGECWACLVGKAPIPLQRGDVLLLPRGDAYTIAGTEEGCRQSQVDETLALEFFSVMADAEAPTTIWTDEGDQAGARLICGFLGCDTRPFNPVVEALPEIVRLHAGGPDRLQTLAEYAVAEAARPAAGSGSVLTRLGELMFIEVIRRCLNRHSGISRGLLAGLRDPVVSRCLMQIHRRPEISWTLPSLATAVGISRSGLAKRFSDRMGVPPIKYLTRWRMQVASSLLAESGLTVSAVASRVGFSSGPAFSRAFSRIVGTTPGKWRSESRTVPISRSAD